MLILVTFNYDTAIKLYEEQQVIYGLSMPQVFTFQAALASDWWRLHLKGILRTLLRAGNSNANFF